MTTTADHTKSNKPGQTKSNGNAPHAPAAATTAPATPDSTPAADAAPAAPVVLTEAQKVERRADFASYKSAKQAVLDAEAACDATVAVIARKWGKGPFKFEDKKVSVVKRDDRYFFKTLSQEEESI